MDTNAHGHYSIEDSSATGEGGLIQEKKQQKQKQLVKVIYNLQSVSPLSLLVEVGKVRNSDHVTCGTIAIINVSWLLSAQITIV